MPRKKTASSSIQLTPNTPVVTYLRDSGGREQELSISQQEHEISRWAAERDLNLVKIYRDTHTGRQVQGRDEFQQMIHDLTRPNAQARVLVLWKFARFARNYDEAQLYTAFLRSRGVQIISLKDNIPDGPAARFFEAAIHWMNQQYSDDLAIEVQRGLLSLVQNFGCMPGSPPRGFKREPVQVGTHRDGKPRFAHRWTPDPEFIPLIRQAFEMRAAGRSLQEINTATRLFGTLNSYRTFFGNRLYIGILVYGELVIENYCEPIIDLETWEAVQRILEHHASGQRLRDRKTHPRTIASAYPLSGLAICARCGSPMHVHVSINRYGHRYPSYVCTRRVRRRDCDATPVPTHTLDAAVLATLDQSILKPENLLTAHQVHEQELEQYQAVAQAERRRLNRRLNTLHAQITRITDAIAQAGHSTALLKKLHALEDEEITVKTDLANLGTPPQPAPELTAERIAALTLDLPAKLRTVSSAQLRIILTSLLDRVVVERDGDTICGMVYYYYPPGDPASGQLLADNPEGSTSPLSPPPITGVPISHTSPGVQ